MDAKPRSRGSLMFSRILLGIAILLFIFVAFNTEFLGLNFTGAGLAFLAASFFNWVDRGPNA